MEIADNCGGNAEEEVLYKKGELLFKREEWIRQNKCFTR